MINDQKIFFLHGCIGPEIVNSKITLIFSWINDPDKCWKARGRLTNTHVTNQLAWMDSKLWVVEYHKSNYNRAANWQNSEESVKSSLNTALIHICRIELATIQRTSGHYEWMMHLDRVVSKVSIKIKSQSSCVYLTAEAIYRHYLFII